LASSCIQVVFKPPAAEECGETLNERAEKFRHRRARSSLAPD
jgi:hypothetical protein